MSEKQFDIFDDQFRNAAEQHEPAFSEAAWQKMQVKLDEGNRRRRPVAWLWWLSDALMLSLMLYIAFIFYSSKKQVNSNTDKLILAAGQTVKKETTQLKQEEKNTGGTTHRIEQNKPAENSTISSATSKVSKEEILVEDQQRFYRVKQTEQPSAIVTLDKKSTSVKEKHIRNTDLTQENNTANTASNKNTTEVSTAEIISDSNDDQTLASPLQGAQKNTVHTGETSIVEQAKIVAMSPVGEDSIASQKPAVAIIGSTEIKQSLSAKKTTSKKTQPASKGFFLHGGLAPELSFIKGNEKGPYKLAYGGGVGYTFSNRWNVQAGVYITQKKYIAGPTDYKAKPGTYYYNLTIYHINAECRITEIPLSVTYNVMQRKRQSIFVSTGFSSLIMNKERYNYHYERINGAYGNSTYTYRTNNFYLFAATQVSAGYQYKLNNKFSVSASPYIKIPLYGVGEGSVKITSAGMMMGLQYQLPSLKRPKH